MHLGALDDLDDAALAAAYAAGRPDWLRLNFVSSIDGAIRGADGLSKSLQNEADGRVFGALRELADAIVVGAGTVRDEGYRPNPKPIVLVSRSAAVPPTLLEGDLSQVHMVTGAQAPRLGQAHELLGDRVLVLGEDAPDLSRLRPALAERGYTDLLCEGGPALARDLVAAGLVDEFCLTVVGRAVAGDGLNPLNGAPVDAAFDLELALTAKDAILTRWLRRG